MKINILIIEDDQIIADFMKVVIEQENHQVTCAYSGLEGISAFQTEDIDLVLLDLGLPDTDGLEVLKLIRKQKETPVIIISARNDEAGKVKALDFGADDYITKPFGTAELLARIRTALRHSSRRSSHEIQTLIRTGDLTIDLEKRMVFKKDQEIHLTKNEFKLIQLLGENLGKVVTYKQMMTLLWGPYSGDQQILRVNMSNIRKKVEVNPIEPEYIQTEIGVGYRMKEREPTAES